MSTHLPASPPDAVQELLARLAHLPDTLDASATHKPQRPRAEMALAAGRFATAFAEAPKPGRWTPKLADTFRLIARGRPAQQVGEELGISLHTVRLRRSQVYQHLGVSDRHLAVLVGLAHRVVPVEHVASPLELPPLGTYEIDTLALRASGMAPMEIAAQLGIPVDTIKSRLRRAAAKLNQPSVFNAVVSGAANGLFDFPGLPRLPATPEPASPAASSRSSGTGVGPEAAQ
ncbi:LuxR C-terminal-related transcriptional regulator [Kitasatospora griseola]|uniref:LuxR C-terminal-related transcriptional regulator n=1 Tax=Kitasatospora griseola TaxID=2064 RepID=UPI0038100E1A